MGTGITGPSLFPTLPINEAHVIGVKEQIEQTFCLLESSVSIGLRGHCWIGGGAIVSLLQGEEPNDWDVFVNDPTIKLGAILARYEANKMEDGSYPGSTYHQIPGLAAPFNIVDDEEYHDVPCKQAMLRWYLHARTCYDGNRLCISPFTYTLIMNKWLVAPPKAVIDNYKKSDFKKRGYRHWSWHEFCKTFGMPEDYDFSS